MFFWLRDCEQALRLPKLGYEVRPRTINYAIPPVFILSPCVILVWCSAVILVINDVLLASATLSKAEVT